MNETLNGVIKGIRHISNAGLKDPNSGINNLTVGLVILKALKQKP